MKISEVIRPSESLLVNPSRREFLKLLSKSYDVTRLSVDSHGDVFVWDAYHMIHSDINDQLKTGYNSNPLTELSLYGFKDTLAARVHEVGDEQVHPELTKYARQLPNIKRIWGANVTCIDIHGEP